MISATDLKNGTAYLHEGRPYKVLRYSLIKIGRGGATVRVNARNLVTGSVEDKTFSSNFKVENISTTKRNLLYLYSDANVATFMDPSTYEQIEISKSVIKDELKYIKEGQNVDILFWDEKALSADISPKITLEVSKTNPGVKGNSTSNVYKPATLENGLSVKVPLFIKPGDRVRIDTRTGEYVERAK